MSICKHYDNGICNYYKKECSCEEDGLVENCERMNYGKSTICDKFKELVNAKCDVCANSNQIDKCLSCNKGSNYRVITNRDMLEKKIHEMSNEELADHLYIKSIMPLICKKELCDKFETNCTNCMAYQLSQPYEENNYVVYKNNNYDEKIYYAKEDYDHPLTDMKRYAKKFTLQQANEKRKELNNKEPLSNWCVEEK